MKKGDGSNICFIISIISIFILIFTVYANSINNSFHFDDDHSIVKNSSIRSISNIPRFFIDPSTFSFLPWMRMYRPVLLTSYAINYAISGLDVRGFRLTNILLHAVNTTLIYLIIAIFIGGWIPLWAALFFGLLPINSQAVNYISSRSVLLVTTFYLLSFFFYIKSLKEDRRVLYPLLSISMYAFSLLTKEIAITLPIILILYDYLFIAGDLRGRYNLDEKSDGAGYLVSFFIKRIKYYLPFWLISAGYLILRRHLLGAAVIKISRAAIVEGKGMPRSIYSNILTQLKVIVLYLREIFLPYGLSPVHDVKVTSSFLELSVVASLLLILFIISCAIWQRRRYPLLTFGVLWFFITLLPETILPLVLIANEHRAYLPSTGIAFSVGMICYSVIQDRFYNKSYIKPLIVTIMVLFLVMSSIVTMRRNKVWRNGYTLWSDAFKKAPRSYMVHFGMGSAYKDKGEYDKAIEEYKKSIEIYPDNYKPYEMLGIIYFKLAKTDDAVKNLRIAVKLKPDNAIIYYNLGIAYAKLKRFNDAEEEFKKATIIWPDYSAPYVGIGKIEEIKGNREAAIDAYRKALSLDPSNKEARMRLNRLLGILETLTP